MLLLLLLVVQCALVLSAPAVGRSFAVIFDCGSTGTRVHVFSWRSAGEAVGGLPDVKAEPGGYAKVSPGISSFEAHPEAAGGSLKSLLDLAERAVPASEHAHTRVLLHATAGMRLVARRRAQRIYSSLFEAVQARGTFKARREDFGTLSGEDEGVFGWLCANYLLKRAGSISELGSVGALDLGGGSTQITLATNAHAGESSQIDPRLATEAARPAATAQPRVALPSGAVSVFTHSHLGFGNKQVLAAFAATEAAACLAAGANASWEPSNRSADYAAYLNRGANEGAYMLKGKGDFDACDAAVRRVLASFDRHGQPPLRHAKPTRFVAMSLFFYVEHFVHAAGHLPASSPSAHKPAVGGSATAAGAMNGVVTAGQLLAAARGLCSEDDASLRRMVGRDPLTTEDAMRWRCFDATYSARLLTDGYGFDENEQIDFRGEIEGVEVEWTLGALLNQLLTQPAPASGSPSHAHDHAHHGPGLEASAAHSEGPAANRPSSTLILLSVLFTGGVLLLLARRASIGSRGLRVAEKDTYGRVNDESVPDKWP